MNYFKIGKAADLEGRDKKIYRLLEIFPGFLSWFTILFLIALSYFKPLYVTYFIIAFDVYWLLLVIYLSIHLIASYKEMRRNSAIDWRLKLYDMPPQNLVIKNIDKSIKEITGVNWNDIVHLIILPIYKEGADIIKPSFEAIINSGYPLKSIIIVLAVEERAGQEAIIMSENISRLYSHLFKNFLITIHPDNLEGEIKGKGSNQAWAAKIVKKDIIDRQNLDADKIIVSVFDADTIIYKDYFFILTYKFLTVSFPHRKSYQPIPIYNNNIWEAPFFSRVAASSNTFWQMMQQIRQEKLATYSSHSMTWRALEEIGYWSTSMVSEDSRIYWHCFCFYKGDYDVEPLHYPVSMDVCMDDSLISTAKNLYRQQRRWGWGVENVPYLIFNTLKQWSEIPKGKFINRIFMQLYGFHSWATNALIIAVIGWLPLILGGDRFTATVLSNNLPSITRMLMMFAMSGLVISAILSTLLLPRKPKKYNISRYIIMLLQWIILPVSIIIFGSIPGLDAQTRLIFGKYLGFWATPKRRSVE
jgi:hypothetical protein